MLFGQVRSNSGKHRAPIPANVLTKPKPDRKSMEIRKKESFILQGLPQLRCIEGFEDVYKEELRSLMTWNFQSFKKSQTMTA
ncbi:MAG: hypothetical protein ACI9S8_001010 [Chlamydiales bacterium]|jgi:hypothetical protein